MTMRFAKSRNKASAAESHCSTMHQTCLKLTLDVNVEALIDRSS